ncbi:MAG TPA: hypothetical protein VK633_09095 [Verrucomicrobiae bacterium]|nr:hypothetical protein [Verrucomicrobiae bacterium]
MSDARAFIIVTTEGRVLPSNLVQLNRLNTRVTLNRQECIGCLYGAMLPRVSRKHQARIPLTNEPNQFEHLAAALADERLRGAMRADSFVLDL